MRLFVAIELPETVIAHLRKMQDGLRPVVEDARWTRPDQFHLTLKFLGETPEQRVTDLATSLRRIKIEDEIRLHVDALVCFPPRGLVRVVAAALHDADGRCAALQQQIDRACNQAGFPLDSRRWTAHLTLARTKNGGGSDLRRIAAAGVAGLLPGPSFSVNDFALIQSRLDRHGPTYVRIA